MSCNQSYNSRGSVIRLAHIYHHLSLILIGIREFMHIFRANIRGQHIQYYCFEPAALYAAGDIYGNREKILCAINREMCTTRGGVLTYMFSIGMCRGKDPPFLT